MPSSLWYFFVVPFFLLVYWVPAFTLVAVNRGGQARDFSQSQVPAIKGKDELSTRCALGGNFPPLKLPPANPPNRCVLTCDNFPRIKKMVPEGWTPGYVPPPVLGGQDIEYVCRNKSLIPELGQKVLMNCLYTGVFEVSGRCFCIA